MSFLNFQILYAEVNEKQKLIIHNLNLRGIATYGLSLEILVTALKLIFPFLTVNNSDCFVF